MSLSEAFLDPQLSPHPILTPLFTSRGTLSFLVLIVWQYLGPGQQTPEWNEWVNEWISKENAAHNVHRPESYLVQLFTKAGTTKEGVREERTGHSELAVVDSPRDPSGNKEGSESAPWESAGDSDREETETAMTPEAMQRWASFTANRWKARPPPAPFFRNEKEMGRRRSFQKHTLKQEIQLYVNFIKLTKPLQAGTWSFWNQLIVNLLILKFDVRTEAPRIFMRIP